MALVTRVVQPREAWSRNIAEMNIGGEFKDALTEPGEWTMGIGGFGETLPYHENKITLDKTKKDKWGLPVLAIDAEVKDNEKKMRIDMVNDAKEMLEAAGVKNVHTYTQRASTWPWYTRNGYSTYGPRSKNIGIERMEPGLGCKKRVCYRWRLYGINSLPKPIINLYGT